MIRALILLLACFAAAPAAAQTPAEEAARASRVLAALWRQVPSLTTENITRTCGGAAEEIEAVEAALPPVLTPESLANVRALRGLLIIPSEDPAISYFFPDMSMSWFASGLGAIGVISEAEGFIGVRDAQGRDIPFQLGSAGGRQILRVRTPDNQLLNFVACAPTWGL